ncbi:type II toxin-antitoxin system MqsA family antitoxin [Pelotomaculum isophthalicicum JI]|uniref:Type II toxin-antitoxin system MqsA family antitoxin n=1 Tax=Pelotomaculum isophthalicicum JI TaxID=947010 RepID=A0A9X4GZA8_9FIRM|nr:type II TA system antitoxin MqsA family protein [Pelotomaculum isophthalicicum]MDF9408555.1 type II toxin-antitoxin system MqsA family antitoxin [Pelotomaculum isophthalicicum JI]
MENKQLFCSQCDEIVEYVLKQIDVVHEIKGETITLKNVEIPHCSVCGSQLSDLVIEEKHFDLALTQYKKDKGLLMPEDIKIIREYYGLSQRAFARALGFAESTINRYELGALQDSIHNSIILLSKQPKNFLTIAKQNRDKLSDNEFSQIESKVKEQENKYDIQDLTNKGKDTIETNAIKRLELMILGLSKSIDNIERKLSKSSIKSEITNPQITHVLAKYELSHEANSSWEAILESPSFERKGGFKIGR